MKEDEIVSRENSNTAATWWNERRPLEKVGVVALATVGVVVLAVALLPEAAATVAGGGLAAGGAYLLKKGLRG
jgi:hypothetical protein